MFHFSYDPERILVRITQQGYWSIADFRAYEAECLALHATIRARHRNYRVISDCRDFPVQPAEIAEAFSVLSGKLLAENKGRYAILVGSILSKLQAKRAIPQSHVQVFTDPDEAMAWLFEEGAVP